jgi:hypothetical protein
VSLNAAIDAAVSCTKCGTKGIGKCGCFERCSCGWLAERGKPCGNPQTRACDTRLRYGKYNRRTKRWE